MDYAIITINNNNIDIKEYTDDYSSYTTKIKLQKYKDCEGDIFIVPVNKWCPCPYLYYAIKIKNDFTFRYLINNTTEPNR